MAENNLDELLLVICDINDALKYIMRYGTNDATAYEKQQLADKKVSILIEKWEWNKPMADKNEVPTGGEMNEVAKDLINLARNMKEHGILDDLQDISVTYRVGELWKTVALTFKVNEQDDAAMTVEEGKTE